MNPRWKEWGGEVNGRKRSSGLQQVNEVLEGDGEVSRRLSGKVGRHYLAVCRR